MGIVGFGFRPTEEELMDFYLKHKLLADDPAVQVMPDIDLCEVEPWVVPVMLEGSVIRFNDPDWLFFSPVHFKDSNQKRFNRKTRCGFWKVTGKERYIRSRDTNTLIGTKKTLVYYHGRVSCCDNSNWVIHEYHAVTFHESQRRFVLCHLMKKPEKTTEGGIDELISDEGETSRSMVSVYGNLATAEGISSEVTYAAVETIIQASPQAEKYITPIQQSPTDIEQEEASFSAYSHNNAYFGNENNIMQTSFQTTEEEEFLNSILADESIFIDEESKYGFDTQSESLKRVYCESSGSGTDAEVVSKLDHIIVDTPTVCKEYPNSGEYRSSKRFKSSSDAVHDGICFPSSNHEAHQEEEDSMFQGYFWGMETSSCNSTTDKYLEVNGIEISSSPEMGKSISSNTERQNNFI